MKLPSYQFLAQMGAACAVIVSLGFVAYELKQARDIALAQIYQDKSELIMSLNLAPLEYPELRDSSFKLWTSPEKLEERDLHILHSHFLAFLSYYENNHFLYQRGMITEEQMDTIRKEIAGWFNDNELYRHYWIESSERGSWRVSYAAEVNRILKGLGPANAIDAQGVADRVIMERCYASGECQPRKSLL